MSALRRLGRLDRHQRIAHARQSHDLRPVPQGGLCKLIGSAANFARIQFGKRVLQIRIAWSLLFDGARIRFAA